MELKPGQDTATAVLEAIRRNPHAHDQSDWVNSQDEALCGTRRCAAGWTLHAHGYTDDEIGKMGQQPLDRAFPPVAVVAAQLLGIDAADAYVLFYRTNNAEAVTALEWLAAGKQLNWNEIMDPEDVSLAAQTWGQYREHFAWDGVARSGQAPQ